MTIDEIHRANLAVLKVRYGGVTKLSDALEKSISQVSQWLNGSLDSKTKKRRGMEDDSCRYIENKLGLETGWMDHLQAGVTVPTNGQNEVDPAEMAELITLYMRVSSEARRRILAAAEAAAAAEAGDS
jgi:hypothetical protein